MIKLGKYEFCVLDLVFERGKLSSTKLWRHIAYSVITYVFLNLDNPSVDWMLTYSTVIICDAGFMAFIKRKYPDVDSEQPQDDSGGDSSPDTRVLSPHRKPKRGKKAK